VLCVNCAYRGTAVNYAEWINELSFFRGFSMAGKKGRSGPPGNLNNVQHPWRSFWARKALRQEDKWILPFLNRYADGLIADAGGEDISSGRKHVIEIAQMSRGCSMLVLKELKEKGFVITTPDGWDMHPGLKELSRFTATELTALRMLGLERKVKDLQAVAIHEDEEPQASGTGSNGEQATDGNDETGEGK
jgi:hypothetical protein